MSENNDIILGNRVKDLVTELEGIAISKCIYLTGCVQYEVQPQADDDDKVPESKWIDELTLRNCGGTYLDTEIEEEPSRSGYVSGGGVRSHPERR